MNTFENQNERAKISLQLADGVLVEIPLALVIREIQRRYMQDSNQLPIANLEPKKDTFHLAVKNLESDGMVHLVVTTKDIQP